MSVTSQYPEHDRLKAISEDSQTIGEFLDNCGYTLCKLEQEPFYTGHDEYVPVRGSIQQVLAGYFEIDPDRIEAEKRAMLEEMRTA